MLGRQVARAGLRVWRGGGAGCGGSQSQRPIGAKSLGVVWGRGGGGARTLVTEESEAAAKEIPADFKQKWKESAPNLDLPRFPQSYMAPRPEVPSSLPEHMKVNLVLPHKFEIQSKEVDMVIVPATTGQLGILPGHVSTIAELKPGVLSIHESDKVDRYFVSSGFAFAHQNSVLDVVALEGVPFDQLDQEEVKKFLEEYLQKFNSANSDLEKAEAQIGVEVYSALSSALAG